ncbi:MAG TPA: hybrid sensor histidine kinase/response regulator, partial [Armatimonadota bacterium]|nr:hybrid sensor histidine kinase/response regulator [Armatimonadota bacterium]
ANLEVLGGMLKERGYRVRQATSGELALRTAANTPPDLILLDIMMPGLDGYETCRRLKADDALRDIPVIFISALSETIDKVRAFSVGGVDYVAKPFQFEEVEARVATHLALRRQQRLLQASYEELRRLEDLRDNLVHMIVHDMRTPLTSIYGFLQTVIALEGERLSTDAREFIGRATVSAESLIEMVSSLLDVSKMEAGQLTLAVEECRLHEVIGDVVSRAEGVREGRELRVDVPADQVTVTADPALLARVVQNLLGNALKFTPDDGRITVGVHPGRHRVRVTVSDTGPGIPDAFRARIFEKFGQVDARQHRQKHSTGLGLTFCKLAVEAHGGAIGVDSEVGVGSTFWFELPLAGPDGGMMPPAAE